MKFYEKTWFVVLMLILFFPVGLILMWRFEKFPVPIRIVVTVVLLLFIGAAFNGNAEDGISAEKYDQDMSVLEEKMSGLLSEKDDLQAQLDKYKDENASLLQQLEEAKEATDQTMKELESKLREQFDEELESAKAAAEERADEEIAAVRQDEAAKTEAAIAKAKKEFEQQAQASTNAQSNTQSNAQPTTKTEYFKNCTDLRGTYPGGVSSDHPAYQSKMDRDNDGWACET